MRKGGYQIINLKNTNFTIGTAMMIDGIHNAIEASYRKPLLLSGLVVANVEYPDVYVEATVDSSAYIIKTAKFSIKVESTDAVTVTNLA